MRSLAAGLAPSLFSVVAGVTYSKASLADLADIWDYVVQDSVFQADRLLRRFQAKLDYLAGSNLVGRPRPEWRRIAGATHWKILHLLPAQAGGD